MVVQAFQKTMQHFLKTKEAVVRRVLSGRSELPSQPAVKRLPVPPPQQQVASVTVGRYVMKRERVSIPLANPDQRLRGLYFLTGDPGPIPEAVHEGCDHA